MNEVKLVYATDDGYLTPTLVSVASALKCASERECVSIVVLDVGITPEKWERFEGMLRVKYGPAFGLKRVAIDVGRYAGLKTYKGSVGTYARLGIPQLFPEWDWCVYVDGDTLFMDDPLKLAEAYDARYAIQGQPDNENWTYIDGKPEKQIFAEARGLKWDSDQYVCAGFITMNLKWFRENDATAKCMDYLRKYPDCGNHDQDALSSVCLGHIGKLPKQWGCLSRFAFLYGDPNCIHYANDAPWKLMKSRRVDYNDAHKLWFDFAKRELGLSFRKLLTEPFSAANFARRYLARLIFKTIFPFFALAGFPTPIGRYLRKHYR